MNSEISTQQVNVAVVGLGFMGVVHLKAYQSNPAVRIAAVCDAVRLPVNGILKGVAGNVKKMDDIDLGTQVKVYTKLQEVLNDPEVELVDLCTPTPLHPEQAIATLRAGKKVFCEKPLARTSAQAREIVSVEKSSGSFVMPAMCMRFWPGWSWLKQVTEEKPYGKIIAARFRRMSEMPGWSKQGTYTGGNDLGGALFDLHIHDVDFIQFLFGRPAKVFSTGLVSASGSVDHVVTQYMYPAGPLVYAEGSWLLIKGFSMAYSIHCEHATLDFDLTRGADAMQVTEEGKEARVIKYDGPDGYSLETQYVVDCVLKGKKPTVVAAQDGLTALEICEAEEKSVKTGEVVAV
jgi:predicted dehydrogenase